MSHLIFYQLWYVIYSISIRASTVDVANVPNVKYLANLPHQTQKWSFMRCVKSQKLYNMATIPLQICNGTNRCCKNFIVLYSLFSLLSLHFFLFSSLSLFGSLSLLPVLVPSLFDQSGMFTGSDDDVSSDDDNALRHPRSATLPATLDLTHA